MLKETYFDASEYSNDLVNDIVERVVAHKDSRYIWSIIMVGSFGRNEPTFDVHDDGSFYLRSDVEILLICKNMHHERKLLPLIREIEGQYKEALEFMAFPIRRLRLVQNFNFAILKPRYKTLFMYDIINSGHTVWGDDYLKDIKVELDQVDLYEAKKIVANRIAEYIRVMDRGLDISLKQYQIQWRAKTLLAVGTAWLMLKGEYVSSYRGQFEEIKKNTKELEKEFGKEFCNDYMESYEMLRNNGEKYDVGDIKLRKYIAIINQRFRNSKLNHSKCLCTSKRIRMAKRYLGYRLKYGIRFEDNIYEQLIDYFVTNKDDLMEIANDWYNILY